MKEYEQKEIEEIQEVIIESAIQWANEINEGNSKNANRLNSKINKVTNGFKDNQEQTIRILVPLLQNDDPSVRLFASIHSLNLGIEVERCLQILRDLADDHSTRGVCIMAYINLKKWNKHNNMS